MYSLPETCSVTDFRDNIAAHLRKLKTAKRPKLLTHNGKAAAVVMSPEEFETCVAARQFLETTRAINRDRRGSEGSAGASVARTRLDSEKRAISAELLKSLKSGPSTPLTARDFDRIRLDLRARNAAKRRRKSA